MLEFGASNRFRCSHRFDVHGNQRFTFIFVRANSECHVPRRWRQLVCRAVKIKRAAMAITLTQTKDKMLVLHDSWGRDWLDFTCKKQRVRVAVSKRLQHFVPAQKLEADLGECQLVVESQTRLQRIFGKKLARGFTKCFSKAIEIFFAHCQSGRHFMSAEFFKKSAATH